MSTTGIELSNARLARLLQRSRSRWRTRRMLEGAAMAVLVVAVATVAAVAIMDQARFDAQVIAAVRLGLLVVSAGAGLLSLVLPLFTRMADRALARYLEERAPGLDALLMSAVVAPGSGASAAGDGRSESLHGALMAQAAGILDDSPAAMVEQPRARRALLALLGTAGLFAVLFSSGPATLRHGLAVLIAPASEEAHRNPYVLAVEPGDVVLLAGSDLRVQARVEGFDPGTLSLYTMAKSGTGWQRMELNRAAGKPGHFEQYLFDLQAPLHYQVGDQDLRSPVYSVQITPRPVAERIDLGQRLCQLEYT